MTSQIIDTNDHLAAELLTTHKDVVQEIAWRTAEQMPGGYIENLLICAVCEEPWDEFLYGINPTAKAQALAVKDMGESPISICSIPFQHFMDYLKGWNTPITAPKATQEEQMIRVLVLHEQGFQWTQVLAVPLKKDLC